MFPSFTEKTGVNIQPYKELSPKQVAIRRLLVDTAVSLLGMKTRLYDSPDRGLTPEDGFDCSGFILYLLHEAQKQESNLFIPERTRHANEIFQHLGVYVHAARRLPGDIVIHSRDGYGPTHVSLYVGQDALGQSWRIDAGPGRGSPVVEASTFVPRRITPQPPRVPLDLAPVYIVSPVGYVRPIYVPQPGQRWMVPI